MSEDNSIERLKNNDQIPHFQTGPDGSESPVTKPPINEADPVDEAEWESFPASDPPSYNRSTSSPSESAASTESDSSSAKG